MPHSSRWKVDIPQKSLPALVFEQSLPPLPDTPIFVDAESPETLKLTWSQYEEWCKRVAAGLVEAGLRPQDRVLVYSGNNIFFPVIFMGVLMAGGIISTANPAFVARELAYQLNDSKATFLLVAESSLSTALKAADLTSFPHEQMFIFDDGPLLNETRSSKGVGHWSYLIANEEQGKRFRMQDVRNKDDAQRTVALLYSSGTTGVPKGVELTHYGLVANCVQLAALYDLDPRNRQPVRHLAFLPMYHGLGLLTYATIAPYRGATTFVMKKYSLNGLMKNIQRFRITELTLVPPILVAMAKSPDAQQGTYDLSSVWKVHVGAAPLSRQMCAEFEKLWPDGRVNVKQGWGMTESPVSILNWDERETSTTQAVGEPVANCEIKIMNEDCINEMAPGQAGELWCRTPNVMKGYWGKPAETQNVITYDGWLRTGDIAFVDSTGKYSIVDRKKELIKVKGNQVAPAELEAVLLDHPEIQDAAVVGAKKGEDEEPVAYIVRKPGTNVTAKDILIYMAERTAKIKRITGGIFFCELIPKNPSGKVLRRQLRDRVAKDIAERDALITARL